MPNGNRLQELADQADNALAAADSILAQPISELSEKDVAIAAACAQVSTAARLSMLVEIFGGTIEVKNVGF